MRVRNASRILLLNEKNQVLLFKIEDSFNGNIFWISPGGGLEEGETFEAAAIRELWEETGIRNVVLGPWVWTREKEVHFKGNRLIAHEHFFVVRVQGQDVVIDHMLEDERADYRDHKWWSLEELQATEEDISPEGIAELLVPILEGTFSSEPVLIG